MEPLFEMIGLACIWGAVILVTFLVVAGIWYGMNPKESSDDD